MVSWDRGFWRRSWHCSWILLLFAQSAIAGLTVQSQRQQMAVGETLAVVISSDSGLDLGQLNLSPLEQDFQILSRSSNTSISLVNGARSSSMSLNLELAPKRSGELSIPSLSLSGESSAPIQISVSAAATANPALDSSRNVILEVEVDTETPYVQQQLRYTVKLYFAINLSDGNLSEPSSDSALIERLGQDASYRTQIDGRPYQVVERRYALTPQASGPLQIPPVTLSGRQVNGRGFFDRGQPISIASRAVNLEVKPRPAEYQADPWLPARSLALQEQLSDAQPRVGEPITRTLSLSAIGLPQSLLPVLEMQPTDAYQVYADQPTRTGNSQDGWLVTQLEQKIAVVPSRAGSLTLPALEISWWDVTTDQQKTAKLASRVVEVLPAVAGAAPATAPLAPIVDLPSTNNYQGLTGPTSGKVSAGYWPWLSALLASLWLVTLIALFRARASMPRKSEPDSAPALAAGRARKDLLLACQRNDAGAAEQASLQLYRARGGPHLSSAWALADALPSGPAKTALMHLDRRRYGLDGASWEGAELIGVIDLLDPNANASKTVDRDALAELYAGSAR